MLQRGLEGSWLKRKGAFSVYVAIWNARSAGNFRVMAAAAISSIFGGFLDEGYLVLRGIKCRAWEGVKARGGRMAAKRAIHEPIWGRRNGQSYNEVCSSLPKRKNCASILLTEVCWQKYGDEHAASILLPPGQTTAVLSQHRWLLS